MGGAREAQARQGAAVNNADPSGRSHQEMNRREFFLTWIFQNRSTSTEVEVMEVFAASDGPSAFLVHHASEAARTAFGEWLRANDGARIVCRLHNGTTLDGVIFRVKMCFGRGLVLTRAAVAVRPKDIVSIN
ncbi:MAG: hypothetical protein DMG13_07910 [Acidobacteria bacterium]|nr:MAG: hypothetical protein DMG13_07910 [Acidobacteriota bacterium]